MQLSTNTHRMGNYMSKLSHRIDNLQFMALRWSVSTYFEPKYLQNSEEIFFWGSHLQVLDGVATGRLRVSGHECHG